MTLPPDGWKPDELALRKKEVKTLKWGSIAQVVVSVPIFYHYSRVLWLHFDMLTKPETFVVSEGRHPRMP